MSDTVALFRSYADKSHWKPSLGENGHKKALQDSSWADGLRGIAAVFVMCSHLTLAFARYIVRPADGENGPSSWMQRPIFRLVGQGPAWVALFFILSGFVNSLKPVKLARAGNVEPALSNLAVSSFRRSFRLFLPATAATILSWFITQFGAYETAKHSDAYWLYTTSPSPSSSWGTAVEDLVRAIRTTWLYNPENPYDQPQWALFYLLQGSMFVFCALLVTINLTPRWRTLALILCYFWSWNWGIKLGDRTYIIPPELGKNRVDTSAAMVGVNVFTGIMLADLNLSRYPLLFAQSSILFAPPLALFALFLMSFPSQFQPWAAWSNWLLKGFYVIAPENAELSRFWPTIGAQLLTFTIVMSPHFRRILSHQWFLFLGKISFPLYLLHGSFMRSVLSWLLFSRQELTQMEENGSAVMRYPLPGIPTFIVVMPVFMVILLTATHIWAIKVEPWFGVITKSAEDLMFGKHERVPSLPVRKD
ncbi:MAG: hypothetical protein Q9167_005394 [Letrouitia subvulpina]